MSSAEPLRTEHVFDADHRDDRLRNENLHRLGKRLVYQFHILLKTAHIHLAGNVALTQPTEQLIKTIDELLDWDREVLVRLDDDRQPGEVAEAEAIGHTTVVFPDALAV